MVNYVNLMVNSDNKVYDIIAKQFFFVSLHQKKNDTQDNKAKNKNIIINIKS